MVGRVHAGEKQPLPPVHSAKLGMAPRDIQVRLWVGMLDDGDELRPKPRQVGEQIRPCHLLRSRDDRILNIRWLLAAFEHGGNGRVIKRGHGTHVQQHINGRPLSLTRNRAEESIRNGGACRQKLLLRFLQGLDELGGCAAQRLTA